LPVAPIGAVAVFAVVVFAVVVVVGVVGAASAVGARASAPTTTAKEIRLLAAAVKVGAEVPVRVHRHACGTTILPSFPQPGVGAVSGVLGLC
jgi:negative regulator of sigma E activity